MPDVSKRLCKCLIQTLFTYFKNSGRSTRKDYGLKCSNFFVVNKSMHYSYKIKQKSCFVTF